MFFSVWIENFRSVYFHICAWCLFLFQALLFEEVRKRHTQGQTNTAFEYDVYVDPTQIDRLSRDEDSGRDSPPQRGYSADTVFPNAVNRISDVLKGLLFL